jgi:hypothetical protein
MNNFQIVLQSLKLFPSLVMAGFRVLPILIDEARSPKEKPIIIVDGE